MKSLASLPLLLAACGSSAPSTPDAAPVPDAPPVATVVYLNFEGDTVTPGNDTPWLDESPVVKGPSTVPAFYPNDPDRQTKIDAIVAEMKATLAPYDIDLVTTRPPTGTVYSMIVFGGNSSDIGYPPGYGAQSDATCSLVPYHLDFLFDVPTSSQHDVVELAISLLAYDHGIPYTTTKGDCMCGLFTDTQQYCGGVLDAACTIGGADTPVNTHHACSQFTTVDEATLFANAFGTR
jgi:hypothetical protein